MLLFACCLRSEERSDSEHIASTVASLSMVASKRRMADELREDLREALDAGDISLQVYLKEMKKLRVCAITNDSSDGTSAIRTPKAAATSELHRVVESDSPGSADDPEKLSDAEASEPEDDDASSNRDVDDKEGAPASATRTSNATTAFTLSVGDRAMHNARGEVRVEKIGIERDFLNHGRVYISYQKRKSGCKRKMEVNYVWVDRMSLKAIEAWKEVEGSEVRSPAARRSPRLTVELESNSEEPTPTNLPARAAHERKRTMKQKKEAPVRGHNKAQRKTSASKISVDDRVKQFPDQSLKNFSGQLRCQACKKGIFNKWSSINSHCQSGLPGKPSVHAVNVTKWLARKGDDDELKACIHPANMTTRPALCIVPLSLMCS